jgi:dolichol-phosphate mannosyltransferase
MSAPPAGPDHVAVRPASPLVFVVPAYNEEENLPRLFVDLEDHPELFPPGSRLIIVDDGSQDASAAVVRDYAGPLPVELLVQARNQGPGAAFRTGFRAALETCDEDGLVVTLEADTTSDLDALAVMLARASSGTDLVLASVHGGGRMVNVTWLRRTLSRCAGMVTRRALGLDARTVSSFFRVYRSALLERGFARYGDALISERGFACKAELLAKLMAVGATVEEVPVDLDGSRRIGQSKMRLLPTILGYWRLARSGAGAPTGPTAPAYQSPEPLVIVGPVETEPA